MSLDKKVHLRKALQLFYARDALVTKILRADIRAEINKEEAAALGEELEGGGDFHIPFWSDAKDHAIGVSDLIDTTQIRIATNRTRVRLYRLLAKSFLEWWGQVSRGINEKFKKLPGVFKGRFHVDDLDVQIKVEGILALKTPDDKKILIYPYFSEEPSLNEEGARMGLWVMSRVLKGQSIEDMQILDVLRKKSYRVEDYPLKGNEGKLLNANMKKILQRRDKLSEKY